MYIIYIYTTVTVEIAKLFLLDYRFITTPSFQPTFMESYHKVRLSKQSAWYIHVLRLLSKQKCNNILMTLLTIRNAITLQKLVSIVKLSWPNHSVQLNALDVFNLKMAEFFFINNIQVNKHVCIVNVLIPGWSILEARPPRGSLTPAGVTSVIRHFQDDVPMGVWLPL